MSKTVVSLLLICMLLNTNSQYLPTIKDCKIQQSVSTQLAVIRCDEYKNVSILPEIPADLTFNLLLYVNNRRIPVLPDNIYKGSKIKTLGLANNMIELVSNSSFQALFPNTLLELHLEENKIGSIDSIFRNNSFSQNCIIFSRLRALRLTNNKLTHIKSKSLECLASLEELYLSKNEIASIDADAFQNFPRLGVLLLQFNLLKNVDFLKQCNAPLFLLAVTRNVLNGKVLSKVFESLKTLKNLEMSSNNLTFIDDETFKGLSSLTKMDLSNNNLTNITNNSFSHSIRLRSLFLENNFIAEINPELFRTNFFLSYLSFRHNSIRYIRNGDFLYLSSLSSLDLSNNNISEIQDGSLKLSFLNDLDLSYNKLTTISSSVLSGLGSLISLYINDNNITRIFPNAFDNLKDIQILGLNNNLIQSVDFRFPRSLFFLYIQNNQIEYFDPKAFEMLRSLAHLRISNNKIRFLENNLFLDLHGLVSYYFNNNSISEIGSNVFPVSSGSIGFLGLSSSLKMINFQHNNLTMVPKNLNNVSVDTLDLSYNSIHIVQKGSFENLKYIFILFCSNNKISSIEIGALNGIFAELSLVDFSTNRITKIEMLNQRGSLISVQTLRFDQNQIEYIAENAFNWLNVSRLSLIDNPIKHIHPRITDDLTRLSFVGFSKSTLINLDTKVWIEAFSPKRIIKKNIYKFYKAIFLVVKQANNEIDFYDNVFCNITFELLKSNILVNLEDIDKVEAILTECSVVNAFSYFSQDSSTLIPVFNSSNLITSNQNIKSSSLKVVFIILLILCLIILFYFIIKNVNKFRGS